jgi:DNA-directed RNA polymerase sigma subunit (sigma70/sigma32)
VSDSAELDESDRGGITESAVSFAVSESDTSTDDRIDASAILANLERYGLSERQRYIFREHFGRERTFASLAAEFGVSNARVQQLYQNGLSQIRAALGVRP